MPIINTYYINGVDLQSSTAVFLDAALSICAPDGYYSDGSVVRKQQSCILLSTQSCPSCCNETCSLWNFKSILGPFTVSYQDCYGGTIEVTYPDPTDVDVCVIYGSTPTLVSGDADLTMKQECGCCFGSSCATWKLKSSIGNDAAFFYYDCDGYPVTISLSNEEIDNVCSTIGYAPILISGVGTIEFVSCDC